MQTPIGQWPFLFFFLSGFSGLVYQIVWLRLAFASYGVVTPVISVVLSVFMLGLGLGSWTAGSAMRRWPLSSSAALKCYAVTELLIGLGGLLVPWLFAWSEAALLPAGETDTTAYLASSGAAILLALGPFCLLMGVTFPFMMQALRASGGGADSFSYLYLANVLGAMTGTLLTPLLLVEVFGFRGTLALAMGANWLVAALGLRVSRGLSSTEPVGDREAASSLQPSEAPHRPFILGTLFATGLASLGMEVVWTRAFMPVLQTQVYSFAGLLFTYLLATWCGSALYRRQLARGSAWSARTLLAALSLAAMGQLLLGDPRIALPARWLQAGWLLLGIFPYCGLLGYLTPKLIDDYSQGRPGPAGHAYAINTFGCILGPLLASYLLLPRLGVHWSGVLLALPIWGLAAGAQFGFESSAAGSSSSPASGKSRRIWELAAAAGIVAAVWGTSYEDQYARRGARVIRDHTATVIAIREGDYIDLLVNGKPITSITPTTKLMAHLPLASLNHEPQSALVICFGMGTTFRSLLTWDIDVTAVELAPSVRDAFGVYFDDADTVRSDPRGAVLIDDGRRFLKRTADRFDVITLDPPPPVEAAASSLLYSREFYQLVKPRLRKGGILHQWFPGGDLQTFQAVSLALLAEFPHVRISRAFDGWGYHMLASQEPIPVRSAEELAARMPPRALADLTEWSGDRTAASLLDAAIRNSVDAEEMSRTASAPPITDDRPYNEYYLMRRLWEWWTGTHVIVL